MSDNQDQAEQLDGDELGEEIGDGGLPDLQQDGEIGPMSSEDPDVLLGDADTRDDERTRAWREEPEAGTAAEQRETITLASDDEAGLEQLDVENEMLGENAPPEDGVIDAEDAAMHIEPER